MFTARYEMNSLNIIQVVERAKVTQTHYRPGQALRVPGCWSSQISGQSAHESRKVVSRRHRPPLPHRKYVWYSFLLEAESNPRAIVRPEGLCQWKNSSDTIGKRTRELPACSAVPQPTAPPRAPHSYKAIPLQAWRGPEGSRKLKLRDFRTIGTWKS